MRGRPKKPVDIALVLNLNSSGESARKIAERLHVGKDTINRILRQSGGGAKIVAQNSPPTIKSGAKIRVAQKSQGGAKIASDVSGVSCNQNPAPPVSSKLTSTETHPPARPALPQTGKPHRVSFSVAYSGTQPMDGATKTWELKPGVKKAKYDDRNEGWAIETNKGRLVIWLNGCIEGSTLDEIDRKATGRSRAFLGAFAGRFGLKIDWTTFKKTTEEEITIEGPINEVLFKVIEAVGDDAKKLGIVAGDSSHENEVEFKKEGRKVWEGLMYVSNKLPSDIESLRSALERIESESKGRDIELADSVMKLNIQRMEELSEARQMLINTIKHQQAFEGMTQEHMLWLGEQLKTLTEVLAMKQGIQMKRET